MFKEKIRLDTLNYLNSTQVLPEDYIIEFAKKFDIVYIDNGFKKGWEFSELKDNLGTREAKLSIKRVRLSFSANDVDGAYLLGVFNTSGLDGLGDEIKRLKELGMNPSQLITILKNEA